MMAHAAMVDVKTLRNEVFITGWQNEVKTKEEKYEIEFGKTIMRLNGTSDK